MRKKENTSLDPARNALCQAIAQWTEQGELHTTAIPGLSLFRRDEPTKPINGMYEPSICMVLQGAKRVRLGDDTYVYDRGANQSLPKG